MAEIGPDPASTRSTPREPLDGRGARAQPPEDPIPLAKVPPKGEAEIGRAHV